VTDRDEIEVITHLCSVLIVESLISAGTPNTHVDESGQLVEDADVAPV
jgi:hypothetical protein